MNDQFETRLSAVEQRVEFEAGLPAKVDRDLADLQIGQRGMLQVVNALRATQAEQGLAIVRIEQRMDRFEATQSLHTAALNHHSAVLTELAQLAVEQKRRTDQLETKVDALETTVERLGTTVERLDTKVDQVSTQVGQLNTHMARVIELLQPPPAPEVAAAN